MNQSLILFFVGSTANITDQETGDQLLMFSVLINAFYQFCFDAEPSRKATAMSFRLISHEIPTWDSRTITFFSHLLFQKVVYVSHELCWLLCKHTADNPMWKSQRCSNKLKCGNISDLFTFSSFLVLIGNKKTMLT